MYENLINIDEIGFFSTLSDSLMWFCVVFSISGSHGTLLGILNAYVHVIMYIYYFLTSVKPELRNSAWWKKYITQVQLVMKNY